MEQVVEKGFMGVLDVTYTTGSTPEKDYFMVTSVLVS